MYDDGATWWNPEFDEAIIACRSILGLLHYRGIVDSLNNRDDVAAALKKIEPFSDMAERRALARHRALEDEATRNGD
jgi:hypothetical protein